MPRVPDNPKIYHITHLRNLVQIVEAGALFSDAKRIKLKLDCEIVGMSKIKKRRLEEIEVKCHAGTKVGEYVPFYFCPRPIMLYILHKGNHPDLNYTEGQHPIVHLQVDLIKTIEWAEQNHVRWAFSDRNAGGFLAEFRNKEADLSKLNWSAVIATDFRKPVVKEGKQAEFLLWDEFPWRLVELIGVNNPKMATSVREAIQGCMHRPPVSVEDSWYY